MIEYGHNWTQVETCDFISRCYDRDTLLITLLNYGEAWLTGRMICVVAQEHIQSFMTRGWSGWGTDEEITQEMGQHKVLLEESPILETIVEQGTHTIGSSEELGLTEVFESANVLEPDELIVIPLQLGGRTKMLLIGEPKQIPEDLVQFSEELEPLVVVADEVAHQLEELIKLAKSGRLPREDERIPELPSRLTEVSRIRSSPEEARPDASSVIMEMSEVQAELSESVTESTPPQLQQPQLQPGDVPRHTQPIRIQRETTELPSLNNLFNERTTQPSSTLKSGESTHLGTPLNMIHEGMSIEIVAADPPILDKDTTLSQLPGSPFEENPTRSPAPILERPPSKTAELEGVAIIEPIGLQAGSQRTLMGGFSVEDFKKAQERFAQEESKPQWRKPSNTLPGVSTPMAQIIRPKKRHKIGADARDEDITGHPTLKVEAITREYAEQDRQERLAREAELETPLMMPHQEAVRAPTEEDAQSPSQDITPRTQINTPVHASSSQPPPNVTPVVERLPGIGHPEAPSQTSPASTRRMGAIIDSHDLAQSGDDASEQSAASEAFPGEGSRASTKNWAVLFSKLEARDRDTAYSVVEEFDANPAVLARLEEIFPGRLYVDRYQWTAQTLPAVEKHGPVLATLAHLGEEASLILIELMQSESLEIRFYATFLMSQYPVAEAIEVLLERIFDRDMQTRKLAGQGLIKLAAFTPDISKRAITPLTEIVERHSDDFHVEIAAELLGEMRHKDGISSLINVLDRHQDRLKQTIYIALMKIALQPLPSATIAWRTWHRGALNEARQDWVLRALISPSDQIRKLVSKELSGIEGLPLRYDPDQPLTMRQRAQQELKAWFDGHH